MKKLLLLGGALAIALASYADCPVKEPQIFPDQTINGLSPNGVWSAGLSPDGFGSVIRNYATGKQWLYPAKTDMGGNVQESYIAQGAQCASNDGTIVGIRNEKAAYWKDGQWYYLNDLSEQGLSAAKAITPDGSIIVGYAGTGGLAMDSQYISGMPCIWYRQADGTYSDIELLPYPTKDITGRTPQYCNAVSVSDDGSVIGCSVRDYLGVICQPVVVYKNAQGRYTYKSLGDELINPDNLTLPPYPGEFDDTAPNWEEYMTAQQIQKYSAAFDKWVAEGEDPDTQPFPQDFMDAENRAAYMVLYDAWWEKFYPWYIAYNEYEKALYELMDSGTSFQFNNTVLSPDGKTLVTTRIREELIPNEMYGDFDILQHYAPVAFDTETFEPTLYPEGLDIYATAVALDGSILGNVLDFEGVRQREAYIYPQGQLEAVSLYEWMLDINPEIADWMEENMTHRVYMYDENRGVIEKDVICTGVPVITPDLSVIGTSIGTYLWTDVSNDFPDIMSYLMPTGFSLTGVKGVAADADDTLAVLPGGTVVLKGEFASLQVYDLAGKVVANVANPAATVATGLGSGIYIVRAVKADGSVLTRKAAL